MSIPLVTDQTASQQNAESVRLKTLQKKMEGLNAADQEKLAKAAKEFEAMFMDIVVQSMRGTVEASDVMGDSEKVKMFQSMLDSEYAKISAQSQGLKIADQIIRQMSSRMMADQLAQEGTPRENR